MIARKEKVRGNIRGARVKGNEGEIRWVREEDERKKDVKIN